MTRRTLILLAAGSSLAVLLGAVFSQYVGGLLPCKLCIWQRWPHAAAVLIGLVALMLPGRIWPLLGALATLATAAVGVYHTGVERQWWKGPDTCTSGPVAGLTPEELMAQIMNAPLIRCDEIQWDLFGLTMANYNALISFGLALIWLLAARRA